MWKFVKSGKYYYIYNKKYSNARLAQWGYKDSEFGSYDGDLYPDQLWQLIPRYYCGRGRYAEVWKAGNGSNQAFSQKVTITEGVKKTTSETTKWSVSLQYSMKTSANFALEGFGASAEQSLQIDTTIENSLTTTVESDWSKTTET